MSPRFGRWNSGAFYCVVCDDTLTGAFLSTYGERKGKDERTDQRAIRGDEKGLMLTRESDLAPSWKRDHTPKVMEKEGIKPVERSPPKSEKRALEQDGWVQVVLRVR
jgi:hypothetical protein